MLAFVGMIFTDAYTLPGYEFSTLEAHDAGVANGSMSQLLLWLGLLELFSFIGIDQMLRGSGREPGDYGALARSHACAMEPRHLAVRPRGCSCLQIGEAPPLSTDLPTRGMRAPVHASPERATLPGTHRIQHRALSRHRLRPDWLHLGPQEEGGDADEGARQRPTGHVRLRWRRDAGRAHGQLLPVVLLAVGARADAAGGSPRTIKT